MASAHRGFRRRVARRSQSETERPPRHPPASAYGMLDAVVLGTLI